MTTTLRKPGPPKKINYDQIRELEIQNLKTKQIATQLGVSQQTVYRRRRENRTV